MHEKKNGSRKVIVLLLVLALVLGCAVGGTFAWLATKTDPIVNTFTHSNINIALVEHKLDPQTGEHVSPEEYVDKQESIELVPGRTIYKDPTVIVDAGSEACYIRMFMIIDYDEGVDHTYSFEDIEGWFDYGQKWNYQNAWTDKIDGDRGHVIEFRYSVPVDASGATGDVVLEPLFYSVAIPGDLEPKMFECLYEVKLTFIAQAIQVRQGAADPFAEIEVPDVTLDMNDGPMTLEDLIDRNSKHGTIISDQEPETP